MCTFVFLYSPWTNKKTHFSQKNVITNRYLPTGLYTKKKKYFSSYLSTSPFFPDPFFLCHFFFKGSTFIFCCINSTKGMCALSVGTFFLVKSFYPPSLLLTDEQNIITVWIVYLFIIYFLFKSFILWSHSTQTKWITIRYSTS